VVKFRKEELVLKIMLVEIVINEKLCTYLGSFLQAIFSSPEWMSILHRTSVGHFSDFT